MPRHAEISAFILAGGASTRMGADKALLPFGGEPLIVRTAKLIQPLVQEVVVVGSPQIYAGLGLRVILDRVVIATTELAPMRTPVVGIVTALSSTDSDWNLILACDLPYLTPEWVDWLLVLARGSQCQVVMPRTSRGLEPLAAVYRRECAEPILAKLERGVRKVTEAVSDLRIEFVNETHWTALDPERYMLRNMNAPEDYEAARMWWKRKNLP